MRFGWSSTLSVSLSLFLLACDGAPVGTAGNEHALEAQGCESCDHDPKGAAAAFAGDHQRAEAAPKEEPKVELDLEGAPVRGRSDAKVTVVVYSDFQCPFCARGAQRLTEIEKLYGDRVRVAFKHLPLPFHPDAKLAAAAAIAAQRQDKFWELHDRLFQNQKSLGREDLLGHAKALGLNVTQFEADLDSPEVLAQVARDQAEAKRFAINGTPTFFVNGRRITGAQPLETFRSLIDAEL